MIPDNLLIQVEPVRWIGGFAWSALWLWVLVSFSLIVGYSVVRKVIEYIRMMKQKSLLLGEIPWIESPDFLVDAALYLRNSISYLYIPHHGYAHTVREIEKYVDDPTIISLLSKIEHAEYGSYEFSREDRASVVAILGWLREKTRKQEWE